MTIRQPSRTDLDTHFPRYADFDPAVPVWCVTPDRKGCIHRFFDSSPVSPSGRYLAVFQLPFENRQPEPGESGTVCVIDLTTGDLKEVATTCGWEPQMGANLNWGATDHELFFNDVDTGTWTPFAWKVDVLTGQRQRMSGTVYHASPDGKWLVSANMRSMIRTQPGYGVQVPLEEIPLNLGPVDHDGFYLTDTETGQTRLFASVQELMERADPPVQLEVPESYQIYGFHSKFNPQSDWLMLSLRAFPASFGNVTDMFSLGHGDVRFAWITLPLDKSDVHCPVGPEQWVKGGHHATWFPDGKRISMNLNLNRDGLRFVQVDAGGGNFGPMRDDIAGSGHPTVHPDGRHLLTDTYTWRDLAFGDGTIPLRWIDLQTGEEQCLVRVNTAQPASEGVLRVDPHPAWDRSSRFVAFNGYVGGGRRVFLADLGDILDR